MEQSEKNDEDTNIPAPGKDKPIEKPEKYFMGNSNRGVAFVISNEFLRKKHSDFSPREGACNDEREVRYLLNEMGFEDIVPTKRNCSALEMKQFLEDEVEKRDFTDKDCIMCFILSYGEEGLIYGENKDGSIDQIETDTLMKVFKSCKTLAGKPKLFFIQACPLRLIVQDDGPGDKKESERRIPVEADVLMIYSCIPGHLGWDKPDTSCSWFVESLVKRVEADWLEMDFLRVMTRMLHDLTSKTSGSKIEVKLPHISSTLTYSLRFTKKGE